MRELPNYRYDPWRFLKIGLVMLLAVFIVSSVVYYLLGVYYGTHWSVMDCVFMVAITISTIGYGDWLELRGRTIAEIFTIFLAFVGIGMPAFIISTITALIVDGTVGDTVRRKRMDQEISKLSGHTVVCGAGNVGEHCIEELIKIGRKCVVIDINVERLKYLQSEFGCFPFIVGNAELDETLIQAGIMKASHLIVCVAVDKSNLYITLSAKLLNPAIRVVSEGIDDHVRKKMLIAGAASVVSPSAIGGLRLVSELIRPTTTSFLDLMLRDKTNVRFDELTVGEGSKVKGRTIAEVNLRSIADVLIVATRKPGEDGFAYNPRGDFVLKPGCVLVLMGPTDDILRLQPLFEERPI